MHAGGKREGDPTDIEMLEGVSPKKRRSEAYNEKEIVKAGPSEQPYETQ